MNKVLVNIAILPKFTYLQEVTKFLTENWNCLVINERLIENPNSSQALDCVLIYDKPEGKKNENAAYTLKHILVLNELLQFDEEFDRLMNLQPDQITATTY